MAVAFFFQTVSAEVIITPAEQQFSGDIGTVIQKTFSLNNTGNTTVNGSISSGTSGLNTNLSSYSLKANESIFISIYYTLPFTTSSGAINYTWSGTDVTFKATAIAETADIEIYPTSPKAGESLAVILKGGYEGKDAKGLLYCNNNLYAFDMSNGMGIVILDQDAYGVAYLRIFSEGFAEIKKTITIGQPPTDSVRLLIPTTSTINKEMTALLRLNQKPLPDFEIKITSPNGKESYLITDNDGKIHAMLDTEGIWSFNANVYDRAITAITSTTYETMLLSFTGTPSVGTKTVINTEPYSSVEILLDGELVEQAIASLQGTVEFTPTMGGSYEVHGTSGSKKGTCYLDVAYTVNVRLLDALTTLPVTSFEKGRVYQVIVSNNAGVALDNIKTLYITTPFTTTEILPLVDGRATWMPHLTGSYVFTIEETDMQAGASQYVVVKEALAEGLDTAPIIIIVAVLGITFVVMVVIYSYKKHIPLRNIFKTIKFGKKKTSLPFD